MNKLIRKYRFIDGWRIGENESWFTDMAAQGLHLKALGNVFASYERGEARGIRYRIDFSGGEQEAQKRLYAENGWQFVCEHNNMRVFRSPEYADAIELHTDPVEQAFTLTKLSRRLAINAVLITLLTAAAICMQGFALFFGKTPTLALAEGRVVNMPVLLLMYLYLISFVIQAAMSTRKLIRSLREGRPINHKANWRRYRSFTQVVLLILAVMTPFALALPFVQIFARSTMTLPPTGSNQMHIRLADIEMDDRLRQKEPSIHDGVDWNSNVRFQWSPYAPIMLEIGETGIIPGELWSDGIGEYSPSINCTIYKLRFSWMTQGVLRDLRERYKDYDQASIIERKESDGLISLYFRNGETRKEVFAGKGNLVVHLQYYGVRDINEVIRAVEEYMLR